MGEGNSTLCDICKKNRVMEPLNKPWFVIPAKAGIHVLQGKMVPRFRGDDKT
jgi:hypothetical protein